LKEEEENKLIIPSFSLPSFLFPNPILGEEEWELRKELDNKQE
jgi:hypothetical protein